MDFDFTDEQRALRELARQCFAADEARSWSALAEAGLHGLTVPEPLGGLGFGLLDLAVVGIEQGRGVAALPYLWTQLAALTLARRGSAEQAQRWLPDVGSGRVVLTAALPQCDTGIITADGRLTGRLIGVPYGDVAAALLVPVRERLYLVEAIAPGVEVTAARTTSLEPAAEVVLDHAAAEPVGAADAAGWLWERTVVALAAVQAGVTDAALELTAEYTSNRHQFGKPLSSFQGVALKAADAYVDHAAIEATMLQAAWWLEQKDSAPEHVLTAAWWAAEAGQHCVHVSQHLHGGIGADVSYPAHRFFLWGKQIELYLGAPSATLARVGELVASPVRLGDAVEV